MKKNNAIPKFNDGRQVFSFAQNNGLKCEFRSKHGWIEAPPDKRNMGGMAVPLKELSPGVRCKIIKWLAAVLGTFTILCKIGFFGG